MYCISKGDSFAPWLCGQVLVVWCGAVVTNGQLRSLSYVLCMFVAHFLVGLMHLIKQIAFILLLLLLRVNWDLWFVIPAILVAYE